MGCPNASTGSYAAGLKCRYSWGTAAISYPLICALFYRFYHELVNVLGLRCWCLHSVHVVQCIFNCTILIIFVMRCQQAHFLRAFYLWIFQTTHAQTEVPYSWLLIGTKFFIHQKNSLFSGVSLYQGLTVLCYYSVQLYQFHTSITTWHASYCVALGILGICTFIYATMAHSSANQE